MWELTWSDGAVDDVVRLRDFIAKENLEVAKRAAETIKNVAKRYHTMAQSMVWYDTFSNEMMFDKNIFELALPQINSS